jgi:hypothetical protein
MSLLDSALELTESLQRDIQPRRLIIVASELPLDLPDPIFTLSHRHPALIADPPLNGKREQKDEAIWITYEPARTAASRLPEQ